MLANLLNDIVLLAKPALFNLYFVVTAIPLGFVLALLLALAKNHPSRALSWPAKVFIYAFRGSPLFIQFFMVYSLMLAFNVDYWIVWGIDWLVMSPLFIGPVVLILNTTAYSAEIFYGAMRSVPKGELEAATAYGMTGWQTYRRITLPNTLRLAWPSYTNEVVFLFHSTALVYLALPVIDQQKDIMNKAGELFEQDYNIFLHFGVAALYFLVMSLAFFWLLGLVQKHLNRCF